MLIDSNHSWNSRRYSFLSIFGLATEESMVMESCYVDSCNAPYLYLLQLHVLGILLESESSHR